MKQIRMFSYAISIGMILFTFSSCEKLSGIGNKIQGEGPVVSEIRSHKNFKGLRVSICGKINYTIAPEYKIELNGQQNILDEIETKKDDEILVIRWVHPLSIIDCDDVEINISSPDMESLFSSGASDIHIIGNVKHSEISLDLSGSGSVVADHLEATHELKSFISGSGNILVKSGSTDNARVIVSGSGNQDLLGVAIEEADASISGAGNIKLNVFKYLEVRISGSGDVLYKGDPQIDSKISGSGKVRKL